MRTREPRAAAPDRRDLRTAAVWLTTTLVTTTLVTTNPVASALVAGALVASQAGCTSFSFPEKGGAGEAPGELVDTKDMAAIPAGRFLMGASQGEPDEYPAHDVELAAFQIDRNEVTNANYALCVEARVCRPSTTKDDPELGRPTHPVVGVPWRDAAKYCKWLGRRLPTEAEWEYAARAPSFGPFPWEGRFQPLFANARGDVDGFAKTAPVGSFEKGRSGLGVYDLAGNAAEWVSDWYDAVYYRQSEPKDPKGPSLSTGARGVRGGSWADNDYLVRSTRRSSLDPNLARDSVGFRCAKGGAG